MRAGGYFSSPTVVMGRRTIPESRPITGRFRAAHPADTPDPNLPKLELMKKFFRLVWQIGDLNLSRQKPSNLCIQEEHAILSENNYLQFKKALSSAPLSASFDFSGWNDLENIFVSSLHGQVLIEGCAFWITLEENQALKRSLTNYFCARYSLPELANMLLDKEGTLELFLFFLLEEGKRQEVWNLFEQILSSAEEINRYVLLTLPPRLFAVLPELIPEMATADGAKMLVDDYRARGCPPTEDYLLLTLGAAYADSAIKTDRPFLNSLLLAGKVVLKHNSDLSNDEIDVSQKELLESLSLLPPAEAARVRTAICGCYGGNPPKTGLFDSARNDNNAVPLLLETFRAPKIGLEGIAPLLPLCENPSEIRSLKYFYRQFLSRPDQLRKSIANNEIPPSKRAWLTAYLLTENREITGRERIKLGRVAAALIKEALSTELKAWLEKHPDVEKALREKGAEFTLPPADKRVSPHDEHILQQVRRSEGLLFTRNISMAELENIAADEKIAGHTKEKTKYYRLGLGHEYGKPGEVFTIIMKRAFWEKMKNKIQSGQARVENLFLPEEGSTEQFEELAKKLTGKVEYNRQINLSRNPNEIVPGVTIAAEEASHYMGLYPQLETTEPVPLDQVQAILVPEHLFSTVKDKFKSNLPLLPLFRKVKSGTIEADFMAGREYLARREKRGGFEPNMGYHALSAFENAYFRLILEIEHQLKIAELCVTTRFYPLNKRPAWTVLYPPSDKPPLNLEKYDWKIFVNPRPEKFYAVLGIVMQTLNEFSFGIQFKVPKDLHAEWKAGRPFGFSSDTPKIVIYPNAKTLPSILSLLHRLLPVDSGFANLPGPSFAAPYQGELLFYKKEEENDPRIDLGNSGGASTLEKAGFAPPYFHKRKEEKDPVTG